MIAVGFPIRADLPGGRDRPVDRVLERAREAEVVLGTGDQERAGAGDRGLPGRHPLGIALLLDVLVVEREAVELEDLDRHRFRL